MTHPFPLALAVILGNPFQVSKDPVPRVFVLGFPNWFKGCVGRWTGQVPAKREVFDMGRPRPLLLREESEAGW